MIRFVYGDNGSGKTTYVINMLKEDAKAGIQSVLIVPEQQAVQTEILTLESLPPKAQLTLEVLNFSRLYNRVCREYGGLCYSYITKPMKHLMMWRALRQVAPMLQHYSDSALNDPAFVKTMLGAIGELKSSGIGIDELGEAIKLCENEQSELAKRLEDIMTVYTAYNVLVSEKYSDSADDLSKLYDILKENDFFKGKNVYIDSFTSFTSVEHRIIERIFASADNTIVTVPLPNEKYSDISTASTELSLRTMKKHADRWGGHTDTVLDTAKRDAHPVITYLSQNLWNMSADTTQAPACDGHIVAEICETSYAEAEAVASHILELLRNGERCRNIAIIMRDAEKYRGIIEPALDKAGIPFFLSEKTDVCALAPIKLILSALRIHRYNWRKNDIISHIKTGLCNIPLRDVDLFEEYINTWNISGSRFTDNEWSMNPDGYTDRISPRGEVILSTANRVRRELCDTLHQLFVLLEAASEVPDMCKALYNYMQSIELEKNLTELAQRERADGNLKAADELDSAYGIILKALADTAEAMSGISLSISDFSDILKTVFEQTEIGTIPTSVDEVTIGSASILRTSNPKYVFVMGLCEGEFPANIDDRGIFTAVDRDMLIEYGVELGTNSEARSSDELMFVKKAFGAPLERLYLFTSTSSVKGEHRSPSLPFQRVLALFEDLKAHKFVGGDLQYLCGSPKSAAAHIRNIASPSDKEAVTKAVEEHLPTVRAMSVAPSESSTCRVSPELVKELIGDKIYISPSSLEKYVKCPFSYYTGYMLSLREKQYGSFRANNFGTFVHHVLEHMIKYVIPEDINEATPSDKEISEEISRVIEAYIKSIAPDESRRTSRMSHLYNKLKKLSLLLISNTIKEFKDSDFRPAFFELHTNGQDGNPKPLSLSLENGARLVLKGYIDRVDIWKNDGNVYVRIVDYKTGQKDFSLEDVSHGLNTQMLLYLFSVCRDPGTKLREGTGLENDQLPIPAGIVYLSSALPKIELNNYSESEQTILERTEKELSRSGILLNDEDIINAFSHSSCKELLMGVTKDKNGEYTGKALISEDVFTELYQKIEQTLKEIGGNIYQGIADSAPSSYAGDPCKYCSVRPICRKKNN